MWECRQEGGASSHQVGKVEVGEILWSEVFVASSMASWQLDPLEGFEQPQMWLVGPNNIGSSFLFGSVQGIQCLKWGGWQTLQKCAFRWSMKKISSSNFLIFKSEQHQKDFEPAWSNYPSLNEELYMMNLRYFYFSAFLCIKNKRIYSKVAFCRLWAARVPHSSTAWSNHSFPACCWRDVDAGQNSRFWFHIYFLPVFDLQKWTTAKTLDWHYLLQFDE